jgi:hypothetical protein
VTIVLSVFQRNPFQGDYPAGLTDFEARFANQLACRATCWFELRWPEGFQWRSSEEYRKLSISSIRWLASLYPISMRALVYLHLEYKERFFGGSARSTSVQIQL